MSPDENPDRPERQETDESLRTERDKTDRTLARQQGAIEEDADAVLEAARDRADDVLRVARERADERLRDAQAAEPVRAEVATERVVEDQVLDTERSNAAAQLAREREERQRALESLLGTERDSTDKSLLVERERVDAVIASRDEFLGMVSHDLRTLLGGVALSAALLVKDAGEDPARDRARREAVRIQRYVARMNRLLGDLLDVVSMEAGQLHVAPARHDAATLLRETLEAFQPVAAARGIVMTGLVAGQPLLARYDHDRIIQVLANLMSNALKFTDPGGQIEVHIAPLGPHVQFSVRDTGCGVPADQVHAIFDRFVQVGRDRRGLGLGLYISRCIVEAHGGRIGVESVRGEGSTFFFTLPAESAA